MSNIFVLDTSFLQALWSADDVLHNHALEISKGIPADSIIIISSLVVAELLMGKSSEKIDVIKSANLIAGTLEPVLESDLLLIQSQISQEKRQSLKAIDCLLLTLCIRKKAELVSFDKRLMRFAKQLL